MLKKLVMLVLVLPLQACMSIDYVPEEYVLDDGRIIQFPIAGVVKVNNLQPNDNKTILYNGPPKWQGNYKSLTEHLRWQLEKEIQKNGMKQSSASQKTIGLKVTNITVTKANFFHKSEMVFAVSLGIDEVLEKRVAQGSPGNIWTVLNGTIALGVIEILKDEKVRKYLAQ